MAEVFCQGVVSFVFRCKITDFLEDQQISLEKSRYKANCRAHSAKLFYTLINYSIKLYSLITFSK